MKIIVSITSAVAGQEAEDHIEADADTEEDDVAVADVVANIQIVVDKQSHKDHKFHN